MNSRVLALVATGVLYACADESMESEQAPLGAVTDKGMYGPDVTWEVYQEDLGDGPVLRVIGIASAGPIGAEAALRQRESVTELLATSASGSWTTGWTEDGQVVSAPEPPSAETLALLETLQRSFEGEVLTEVSGPGRPTPLQVFRICTQASSRGGYPATAAAAVCASALAAFLHNPRSKVIPATAESPHPVTEEYRYTIACPPDEWGVAPDRLQLEFARIGLEARFDRLDVVSPSDTGDESKTHFLFTGASSEGQRASVLWYPDAELIVSPTNLPSMDRTETWGFQLRAIHCAYDEPDGWKKQYHEEHGL